MGTETCYQLQSCIYTLFGLVKLNNPLKGTETLQHCKIRYLRIARFVKLNNPQMGTDTYRLQH